MQKKILFLQRAHPGDVRAREALQAATVAAVFEQSVSVLFRDDGVYQLVPRADDVLSQELSDLVASLADYGVDSVYACQDSLAARGIAPDDLPGGVIPVDVEEQSALLAAQHAVIND